jgi:acyl-homoserine lactone synthase
METAMIHTFSTAEMYDQPDIWRSVTRLRHLVFVEEMGWEALRSQTGHEVDQFDHEHAIHHVAIRSGTVVGYQRMLPTTRPHLLSDVMPELCQVTPPVAPHIFELTRYCVAPGYRDGRKGVSTVGSELITGLVEWGLMTGNNQAIIEFEPMWVLRALQLHFIAQPLGYQHRIGNQNIVATLLTFNDETLRTIRQQRNHFDPVLATSGQVRPVLQRAS